MKYENQNITHIYIYMFVCFYIHYLRMFSFKAFQRFLWILLATTLETCLEIMKLPE